jgi:signal transduction histidine kinase
VKKNVLVSIVVTTSLVLLAALQILWLTASYRSEVFSLRREANSLFRNTIFQLRDVGALDDIAGTLDSLRPSRIRSVQITRGGTSVGDSLVIRTNPAIQMFIATARQRDSLQKTLATGGRQTNYLQESVSNSFSIRLVSDSIHLDSLTKAFGKNLADIGLPLPVHVTEKQLMPWSLRDPFAFPRIRSADEEPDRDDKLRSIYSDTLRLEPSRFHPGKQYQASLVGVRLFVVRKITPQILFSLFLTGTTVFAFVLIYRSLRTQQKLMALKNDFISNMTHELKTPVATVSVALEALRDFHGLNDRQRTQEYLAIAQSELHRLALLTDKIMKSVMFENKEIAFPMAPVALDGIVRQVVNSLRLVLEKQSAQVTIHAQGDDFTLRGNEEHLTSVVYNLLDNALKYSRAKPLIQIHLQATQPEVTLTVADNGIGIAPEHQSRIFERFFRVPTGDVHNAKGYGLGLSYVHSVVTGHGGRLSVQSEPNQGSRFTLTLPRQVP